MARIATIEIADKDLPDVLAALERVWLKDAMEATGEKAYEALSDAQKVRACLVAEVSVRTKNRRREEAQKAIVVEAVEVH